MLAAMPVWVQAIGEIDASAPVAMAGVDGANAVINVVVVCGPTMAVAGSDCAQTLVVVAVNDVIDEAIVGKNKAADVPEIVPAIVT